MLPVEVRPTHDKHTFLRPGLGVGLWLGVAATVMVLVNLACTCCAARNRLWPNIGSLKAWMTSHVATGILALLCAMLHGAMAPGDSPGGHAFWALVGPVGDRGDRTLLLRVHRAARRERPRAGAVRGQDQARPHVRGVGPGASGSFASTSRNEVEPRSIESTAVGRARCSVASVELLGVQRELRRKLLRKLAARGARARVWQEDQIKSRRSVLARRAHRIALMAAHYEDLARAAQRLALSPPVGVGG